MGMANPYNPQNPYENTNYQAPQIPMDDPQFLLAQKQAIRDSVRSDQMVGGQEMDETFTRWQHDSTDLLEYLEYQLKGFEKRGQNWIIPKDNQPTFFALMNERGIYDILRMCRMNFSKIMNSTNLTEKEVHKLALMFELDIIDALEYHYQEYGIKRPQDLNVIFSLVRNPYYALLKQSYENGTRKYLGGLMRYTEGFQDIDRDGLGQRQGNNAKKPFRIFG